MIWQLQTTEGELNTQFLTIRDKNATKAKTIYFFRLSGREMAIFTFYTSLFNQSKENRPDENILEHYKPISL